MNNLIQTILDKFYYQFIDEWHYGNNVKIKDDVLIEKLKDFIGLEVREAVEKAFEEVDTTVEITKNNFLSN